jgi:hypothetical protein
LGKLGKLDRLGRPTHTEYAEVQNTFAVSGAASLLFLLFFLSALGGGEQKEQIYPAERQQHPHNPALIATLD